MEEVLDQLNWQNKQIVLKKNGVAIDAIVQNGVKIQGGKSRIVNDPVTGIAYLKKDWPNL